MTELAAYEQMEVPVEDVPVATFSERSNLLPLPFVAPVVVAGASYLMGGVPRLTDLSFILIALLCFCGLLVELARFPRRFGVGGIVLFAGVLIWFCEDYFKRWFGRDAHTDFGVIGPNVVAKAALAYSLFILSMVVGLFIPYGKWLPRVLLSVPEPSSTGFYPILVGFTFLLGIAPYVFFTADPFFATIYKAMTGGYHEQVAWTTGRTAGNMNFSWGGYMTYLIDTGKLGGVLAVFYALLVATSAPGKIFGWVIWAFWVLMALGTGIRGEVLAMMLPAAALVFLKYQARAAALFQQFSFRGYILAGALLFFTLFGVQFVAFFRDHGYDKGNFAEVDLTDLQGNFMFSESLVGFSLVPGTQNYLHDNWPGETILRPIPDTAWALLYQAVPRALWRSKPVEPAVEWYNRLILGARWERGGNVALTAVGHWFFPYGWFGVIEGGLLFGWMIVCSERALRQSDGRPLGVLCSLAFAVWCFRCFRGLNFTTLYPLVIGAFVLAMVIKLQRLSSPQEIPTFPEGH
jgi:hypothetical protein